MPDKFERFTDRARRVLTYAQEESHRFGHSYIGTEHILLGLVRDSDSVAARVLANMDVTLPKVRQAVEHIIGRGNARDLREVSLTPRAKTVLELAVAEARRLNHHYVGTEHLLLGLLSEGEGVAAGVLESMGATLERVRAEVLAAIGSPPQSTAPAPGGSAARGTTVPAAPLRAQRQSLDVARLAGIVAAASVVASLLTRQRLNLSSALLTGALAAWAIRKVAGASMREAG